MEKRTLRFTGLDDVLTELNGFEPGATQTTGVWSYSQILNHCADELESVVRDVKPYPWLVRFLFANIARKKFLKAGFYTRPPFAGRGGFNMEGNERTALIRIKKVIADFKALPGPTVFHPFYGRILKGECEKLIAYHTAHHFGFIRKQQA